MASKYLESQSVKKATIRTFDCQDFSNFHIHRLRTSTALKLLLIPYADNRNGDECGLDAMSGLEKVQKSYSKLK
jgi:hypothetical protein